MKRLMDEIQKTRGLIKYAETAGEPVPPEPLEPKETKKTKKTKTVKTTKKELPTADGEWKDVYNKSYVNPEGKPVKNMFNLPKKGVYYYQPGADGAPARYAMREADGTYKPIQEKDIFTEMARQRRMITPYYQNNKKFFTDKGYFNIQDAAIARYNFSPLTTHLGIKDIGADSNITWGLGKDGKPILQYTDAKGRLKAIPYSEIATAFTENPELITDLRKARVAPQIETTIPGYQYAFQPETTKSSWQWYNWKTEDDDIYGGDFLRRLGDVTDDDGNSITVYENTDGEIVDRNNQAIDKSLLLKGLGYTHGTYAVGDGKSVAVPIGFRTLRTSKGTNIYDPNTLRLVNPATVETDYAGLPLTTDASTDGVPVFKIPGDQNFTTSRWKIVQTKKNNPYIPGDGDRYTIVSIAPDEKSKPIPGYTNLTSKQLDKLLPNGWEKNVINWGTKDSKFSSGAKGRVVSVIVTPDTKNPGRYIFTVKDQGGRTLHIDPYNPKNTYEQNLVRAILNEPAIVNDPTNGPTVQTLVENEDRSISLESTPFDTASYVPTEPKRVPLGGGGAPTTGTGDSTGGAGDGTGENDGETIFNEKVMHYLTLGIPIGLAVSLALWAIGGAKSENLMGALAAGAGGGALLGGLGAHAGWFGDEEDDTEEGKEPTDTTGPSERTPVLA